MSNIEKIDELEINKNKIPGRDINSDSLIYRRKKCPKTRIFERLIFGLASLSFLVSILLFSLSITLGSIYYRYGNMSLLVCIMCIVISTLIRTALEFEDIAYIISDKYIIKTLTNDGENSEVINIDDINSANFSEDKINIKSESEDLIIENPSEEMIKDIQDVFYFNK